MSLRPTSGRGLLQLRGRDLLLSLPGRETSTPYAAADPTASFSGDSNPNGEWSYGYMDTAFANFTLFDHYIASPFPTWRRTAYNEPNIYVNNTTSTAYGVPPGMMALHPGPSTEPSCLRWTSLRRFTEIHLSGAFLTGDTATVTGGVRRGSTALFTVSGPGSFDLRIPNIEIGDTIDIVAYGAYNYGSTPISVNLSGQAAA